LLNKSLTLSGLQGVCSMGCLLHLLCESAPPNIKIQRTGAERLNKAMGNYPSLILSVGWSSGE